MIVRATALRPMKLAFVFTNRQVIDASDSTLHEAVLIELPVLIAIRAKPLTRIVMPLVGEAHRNPVALAGPEFLDQAILEFTCPFAGEELHDRIPALQEFGAIPPDAVWCVGQRDALWVTRVPRVLGNADFLLCRVGVKRGERRTRRLSGAVHGEGDQVTNHSPPAVPRWICRSERACRWGVAVARCLGADRRHLRSRGWRSRQSSRCGD